MWKVCGALLALWVPAASHAVAMSGTGTSYTFLTTNQSTQTYGVPTTLTATVIMCDVCTTLTGFVKIKEGTKILGTVPVDENGIATLVVSGLTPGTHSLVAYYGGDSKNKASTSNVRTQTITGNSSAPGLMTWLKSYDQKSNLTKLTDPSGNIKTGTYSALNQALSITGATDVGHSVAQSATYTYDTAGNVSTAKDARNVTTNMGANSLGLPKTLNSPDTGNTAYTTNAAGQILTVTDARGKVATYTYDTVGRLKTISYSSGVGSTFTYDTGGAQNVGKLVNVTDESGSTAFAYDAAERPQSQTKVINGQSFTTTYTWGDSGPSLNQIVSITYPSGNQVVYTYGADSRVSAIDLYPVNPNGVGVSSTPVRLLRSVSYRGPGMIASYMLASGATQSFSYDTYGMLAGYDMGLGNTRTLTRDPQGLITAYNHVNTAFNQAFTYHNTGKLKTATIAGVTTSYGYDDSDNRVTKMVGATTYTNAIAATSNRQASFQDVGGTFVPTYDAAGNVTADGTYSYTYSARGRMQTSATAGVTTNYLYDASVYRDSPRSQVNFCLSLLTNFSKIVW